MADTLNINFPDGWKKEFARAAKADGVSLSEWLTEAGRKQLPKAAQKRLPERVKRGRPKKET